MDKLIESFEKLAANYGPTVIDAATGAARMEGISYLFSSVIWLGLAYGAYLLSGMLRKSDEEFARFSGWCFLVVGGLFGAAGVWAVLDPWV